MSETRGWAKPRGSDDGLHHWWRLDGRRACAPDNSWSYDGHTDPTPPTTGDACEACLAIVIDVTNTAKMLGFTITPDPDPDHEWAVLANRGASTVELARHLKQYLLTVEKPHERSHDDPSV
jgi:hypothetical protein